MKMKLMKTNILLFVIPSLLQWQKEISNEYSFIASLKKRTWHHTLYLGALMNAKK